MTAHTIQFNIRVTEDQEELIEKAYVVDMGKREKLITKAAWIREQLLKVSSRTVKAQ